MSTETEKPTCPKCGTDLKRIFSKKKQKFFWMCMGATETCGAFYPDADGKPVLRCIKKGEPEADMPCPSCGSPMRKIVSGGSGDFYSCSKYPKCKGTIDIAPDGSLPPSCPEDATHGPMRLIRKGRNGPFWGCRVYPECKGTRKFYSKKESEHAA